MHTSRSQYQSLAQFLFITLFLILLSGQSGWAQARRLSSRSAIVVDERLAVLRAAPQFSAPFLRRIGRGRIVTLLETQRGRDGVVFYRVAVTRRTRGWLQREAIVAPSRAGDDARLLGLIKASRDFDRLGRARIFLDVFPRSPHRPAILLILGEEAEKAALKLSHEAARRLDTEELSATGASLASYFLNYRGLDRYRRQGIVFTFDPRTRKFHYDGAAWRELNRRYRGSVEASVIRQRE
ncbi:MAG TPA: hypothetical protein VFH15_12355 [Pyrinomonadaceae bacterium]|nr:hypothetical protein [Pyrinomonadaceae bacterium]